MNHPHQAHAEDYQATPSGVLDDMLTAVDLDPTTHVFIDLGAGKGRVMCLAAAYPFRRIVGVELVPSLVADCRANLEAFSAPWRRCPDLEIIEADATFYSFPADPLVVYLYNPFRPPVLRRVVRNLKATFQRRPRPVWLLYYMPVHRRHLDADPTFVAVDEARDWVSYRLCSIDSTPRRC